MTAGEDSDGEDAAPSVNIVSAFVDSQSLLLSRVS